MAERFQVSRRKAAMLIAGTVGASGAPALVLNAQPAGEAARDSAALETGPRALLTLLARIDRAPDAAGRAAAFEQFKAAFSFHRANEASELAAGGGVTGTPDTRRALYQSSDASLLLAGVIVRELDAWPKTDRGWAARFSDLAHAVRGHVRDSLDREHRRPTFLTG